MVRHLIQALLAFPALNEGFRVRNKRSQTVDLPVVAPAANQSIHSGVPVFTMLPLTTIVNNGQDVSSDIGWMFDRLAEAHVDGFMVDVWWGITEPSPKTYVWDGYRKLFQMAKDRGWKVQIVASFHQCGGNVGDDCFIPIPNWIGRNEGVWYKDQYGNENYEYISLFADEVKIAPQTAMCALADEEKTDCGYHGIGQGECQAKGCCWQESTKAGTPWCFDSAGSAPPVEARTPVEMYTDWFRAFEAEFASDLSSTIVEVMVGLGPAGELRYPSYPLKHWNFCGIGEFQCFDQHAEQQLRAQAERRGNLAWAGAFRGEDVGNYNSRPPSSTRFFDWQYQQDQGRFFLEWYFASLKDHGRRVLTAGKGVFGRHSGVHLAAKIAGIHWWHGDKSHAAEVTAGYYNTNFVNAYSEIAAAFKASGNVTFCFTCLEMRNHEMPAECSSTPVDLVRQTREAARSIGIPYAGENALPRYDRAAYDQILSSKGDLTAFTLLRLNPRLIQGNEFDEFKRFVWLMHQ